MIYPSQNPLMISHLLRTKTRGACKTLPWFGSSAVFTLFPPLSSCSLCLGDTGFLGSWTCLDFLFLCWDLCVCYFLCLEGPSTTLLTPSLHITLKVWPSSVTLYRITSLSLTLPLYSVSRALSGLIFSIAFSLFDTHTYISLFFSLLNDNVNSLKEGETFMYMWHLEQD